MYGPGPYESYFADLMRLQGISDTHQESCSHEDDDCELQEERNCRTSMGGETKVEILYFRVVADPALSPASRRMTFLHTRRTIDRIPSHPCLEDTSLLSGSVLLSPPPRAPIRKGSLDESNDTNEYGDDTIDTKQKDRSMKSDSGRTQWRSASSSSSTARRSSLSPPSPPSLEGISNAATSNPFHHRTRESLKTNCRYVYPGSTTKEVCGGDTTTIPSASNRSAGVSRWDASGGSPSKK